MRISFMLLGVVMLVGCESLGYVATIYDQTSALPTEASTAPVYPAGALAIGSFNAQVFGPTKAADTMVTGYIALILQQYDLIAFQEIRDSSGMAIENLMDDMPKYRYVISQRLGRTVSKEQYAYIYDPSHVQITDYYVYNDTQDIFEREPFVARILTPVYEFTMIQVHIKPDNAVSEIRALQAVADEVILKYKDNEILIAGDLNADCNYYDEGLKEVSLPGYFWETGDSLDTTTKSTVCTYDRFITSEALHQYVVSAEVDRFDATYKLDQATTESISDHYPIRLLLK